MPPSRSERAARISAGVTVAGLAAALLLAAHVAGAGDEPWQSPLGHGHPLLGRIWDVRDGRFVGAETVVERLVRARFVLLGEKHDNPDHHRLQADILRALTGRGRRPAVGFEMFKLDDAPAIARRLASAPRDADGIADAVDWPRSGWPAWSMYRPIVQAALDASLPIVPANLSDAVARPLSARGAAALTPATLARLGLDAPLPAALQADLAAELRLAHCGHGSDSLVERMALVQRARDAQMASALVDADTGAGAVLIAGAGHVRTDRGVPMHLGARRPDAAVASLAFLEVADGWEEPAAYAAGYGRAGLPFDFAWFTARVNGQDECARFKAPADSPPGDSPANR